MYRRLTVLGLAVGLLGVMTPAVSGQTPQDRLSASLSPETLEVVAGGNTAGCDVIINSWRGSTADPVEVILPDRADPLNSRRLPGGLIVTGGNDSIPPENMSPGRRSHYEFLAPAGIAAGDKTVRFIVRQKLPNSARFDEVRLTLTVRVVPRDTRSGGRPRPGELPNPLRDRSGPAGSFAGEWDTSFGPMAVRMDGNRASGSLPALGGGFNGQVSGRELRGELHDREGTGSFVLTLSPNTPTFSGKVNRPAQKGKPAHQDTWKGTLVEGGHSPGTGEPARTSKLTLQVGKHRPTSGETVSVAVWLLNGNGLGDMNLELHYDPQVVQPEPEVRKGNLMSQVPFAANARERGVIRIGFFDKKGLKAGPSGTLALLRFRAVGRQGDRTPLRLVVSKIQDAHRRAPAIERLDGDIYIVGKRAPGDGTAQPPRPPQPGTNRPGERPRPGPLPLPPSTLTFGDAMQALRMSVRLIPENLNLDIDGDRRVTAGDAREIALRAATALQAGRQ